MKKLTKVEVAVFGTDICIKESILKVNGEWQFADRVCEGFADIKMANFVAKAINSAINNANK